MGKTFKGKAKVKAKIQQAKRKIARKTKGGKVAAILAAFALAVFLTGCTTADSAQPAKSQTQENRFDDCIFVMAAKTTISNGVIVAEGDAAPALEMFTQTQSLENSGTDTTSQTTTQTPTTDVRPDIDANYNGPTKAGGDALAALISGLTPAAAELLKKKQAEKYTGTLELEKTDGSKVQVECNDGQCYPCADGICSPK